MSSCHPARAVRARGSLWWRQLSHTLAPLGARTVDLTSRPSREAVNRLYVRAGFELRETSIYRLQL